MADNNTPNIQLLYPTHLGDVGSWDTPLNSNWVGLDLILGGISVVTLTNANVVLSAAQYQSKVINFTGTLTGSVTITFPTSFIKSYEIFNTCVGTSVYTVTLQTTAVGTVICAIPDFQMPTPVVNYNGSFYYVGLPKVGNYWDHAGSSVPSWVSGCTIPPYLNCDGTTFSSGAYPNLFNMLGGNTLPDSRGRFRATLNQGTARIVSNYGLDCNTRGAGGGLQYNQLTTSNLPPYTPSGSVSISYTGSILNNVATNGFPAGVGYAFDVTAVTGSFTGNAQGGTSSAFSIVPPGYCGGITMVRAG